MFLLPKYFKKTASRILPAPLEKCFRRRYSAKIVAGFPEEKWPWSEGVKKLISSNDVVVDVGANIGYITGLFSRWVGPNGKVHSFEAVPRTFDLLAYAVKSIGLKNVVLHACGASDRDGSAEISVPQHDWGGENLYESAIVGKSDEAGPGKTETIAVKALDSVLGEVEEKISFLKIDVEGHELEVIHGAAGILSKHLPAFLIEVDGDPEEEGSRASALFHYLEKRGYAPYLYSDGFKERTQGTVSTDYFFLRQEHLEFGA